MEKRGFTIVELSIVAAIIAAISAIAFANFPKFNRELALRREANKLALALRKSQSFALAVREFHQIDATYKDDPSCSIPPVAYPPYGVSLSMNAEASPDVRNNKTYIIFGDTNCSSLSAIPISGYDASPINEQVETFNMAGEVQIASIFGYGTACSGGCSLTRADAVYQRPAPTVVLIGLKGGTFVNLDNRIEINLTVPNQNLTAKVVLRPTGQVSIE